MSPKKLLHIFVSDDMQQSFYFALFCYLNYLK